MRTLRAVERVIRLEEELSKLQWGFLGLSEIRREGEDSIILKSGNLLYFREGGHQSQGGVGFPVHRSLVDNVVKIESESTRLAFLVLRIIKRYSLKVFDISKAHSSKTHYSVIMGDFNAKLGKRSGEELGLGNFGFGHRNHRGHMLAGFMEKEDSLSS